MEGKTASPLLHWIILHMFVRAQTSMHFWQPMAVWECVCVSATAQLGSTPRAGADMSCESCPRAATATLLSGLCSAGGDKIYTAWGGGGEGGGLQYLLKSRSYLKRLHFPSCRRPTYFVLVHMVVHTIKHTSVSDVHVMIDMIFTNIYYIFILYL